MMGSADQLMDMSLAHPYGGENRLADRLLAIKEVREAHQKDPQGAFDDRLPQGSPPGRCRCDRGRDEGDRRARGGGAGRAGRAARRLRPPGCPDGPRPADVRREEDRLDRGSDRRERRTAIARDSTSGRRGGNTPLEADRRHRRSARSSRPHPGSRSASSRHRRRWATR